MRDLSLRWFLRVSVPWIALGCAQTVHAQQTNTEDAQSQDEIVVVGQKSEEGQIDRRTYLVKDNPRTQASNAIDVLLNIPAISISSTGQLKLLGTPGVKVMVEGKEVIDPSTFLRALQGSRLERVEVMTNPSAQFNAEGTAGIINITLRRPSGEALKATISALVGSFGGYDLKASPTWASGRWSIMASAGKSRDTSLSDFERERTVANGPPTANFTETGTNRSTNNLLSGNFVLGFKPNERQDLTLTAFAQRSEGNSVRSSRLIAQSTQVDQFGQGATEMDGRSLSLAYRIGLNKRDEAISASVSSDFSRMAGRNDFSSSTPTNFSTASLFRYRTSTLDFDYVNPISKARRLSVGGVLTTARMESDEDQAGGAPLGGSPLNGAYRTAGGWTDIAGYLTYQFAQSGWQMMPGIRIERRRYEFDGAPDAREDVHVFPSLHLQRTITRRLKLGLSYSRRIARPDIVQLSSALWFSDPATASSGNRNLRPELTDSVESKLEFAPGKQTAILTLFQRTTHDPWVNLTSVNPDGVYISAPANLGTRTRFGTNLAVQGPIGRHLRYSASGNLSLRRDRLALPTPLDKRAAEYDGSLQLEYRELGEEGQGFDSVLANVRYYGPTRTIYSQIDDFSTADLTWTHGVSGRLFAVLKLSGPLGGSAIGQINRSDGVVSRQIDRLRGPRATLSLTYRLGPR
jgi:ferric enterobactin receptor